MVKLVFIKHDLANNQMLKILTSTNVVVYIVVLQNMTLEAFNWDMFYIFVLPASWHLKRHHSLLSCRTSTVFTK